LSIISWFKSKINEENNAIKSSMLSGLRKEKSLRFRKSLARKYKKEKIATKIKLKLPSFISPLAEKG
jgi:hypothetical protein